MRTRRRWRRDTSSARACAGGLAGHSDPQIYSRTVALTACAASNSLRPGRVGRFLSHPATARACRAARDIKKHHITLRGASSCDAAVPQLRKAGAQLGADAVIVRGSSRGGGDRHVVVEGEAIRYTDVSQGGGTAAVSMAAARGFSNGRGCGKVSLLSDAGGVELFQAPCPAGNTLIIECRGESCNARN